MVFSQTSELDHLMTPWRGGVDDGIKREESTRTWFDKNADSIAIKLVAGGTCSFCSERKIRNEKCVGLFCYFDVSMDASRLSAASASTFCAPKVYG